MAGVLGKLRKRHGKQIEIDGDAFFVRSPTMRELRIVDEIRASGAKGNEAEQSESSRYATAAWFGFVICEDTDGTLSFPKTKGESDIDWAKRVEADLSDVENTTLQAISAKVAKLTSVPADSVIVKN